MKNIRSSLIRGAGLMVFALMLLMCGMSVPALAHPLGNFTINHFARVEVSQQEVRVRYVVDMAEISTFQELQPLSASGSGSPSNSELDAYLDRVVGQYAGGLLLTVDGARIPLEPTSRKISLPAGAGGLPTLRVECDLAGIIPAGNANGARRLRFEDTNHFGRIGWRELVLVPASGVTVFHEGETEHAATEHLPAHTHKVKRIGIKPLLVGAMHGLAGSAALTLPVLTQIGSVALGLLYLGVFGFGSIIGMLLMSGLVGLPFALSARRLTGVNYGLQTIAGAFSMAFGLWYAYETGIASGLLGGK